MPEHRLRPQQPLLAPANQKPAAIRFRSRRAGGVVTCSPIGWGAVLAARAVRGRREAWAAALAPCRLAAAASYPRLPRGSRDPFAELRERHARAGKPGLGEPSGPPGREHAPWGLHWVPPWSLWWSESCDLTQAWGGVRGSAGFRGGASRGHRRWQTPRPRRGEVSVQVTSPSVAEHGGLLRDVGY